MPGVKIPDIIYYCCKKEYMVIEYKFISLVGKGRYAIYYSQIKNDTIQVYIKELKSFPYYTKELEAWIFLKNQSQDDNQYCLAKIKELKSIKE